MPTGRTRMPEAHREAVSRGPSGFTVFIVFLLLAALCIGAGFTIGRYILAALQNNVADSGGQAGPGGQPGGGGTSGGTGGGQAGGSGAGGAVPAGGGPGSVNAQVSPLSVYGIQVGAFSTRANADKVVQALAGKGYPGYVLEPSGGSSLYRVRTVTLTDREVASAALARVKTQGYSDAFVAAETIDATPLTLTGSSLDYLRKAAAGIEALASCLRIEGDLWDHYHSGTLNRTEAAKNTDALVTTIREAKDGLAGLQAPSDLSALGDAVQAQLIAATTNLSALKSYLSGQADADRLAAESSYIGLVDGYARMSASLRTPR